MLSVRIFSMKSMNCSIDVLQYVRGSIFIGDLVLLMFQVPVFIVKFLFKEVLSHSISRSSS